jgi:hypothetical protein
MERQTPSKYVLKRPRYEFLLIMQFFGIYSENENKSAFIERIHTIAALQLQ